jgi:hypothetical protein
MEVPLPPSQAYWKSLSSNLHTQNSTNQKWFSMVCVDEWDLFGLECTVAILAGVFVIFVIPDLYLMVHVLYSRWIQAVGNRVA